MDGDHLAAHLRSSVAELQKRATLAMIGLAAALLARTWDLVVRIWSLGLIGQIPTNGEGAGPELMARLERADALVNLGGSAIAIAYVVCGIVFLRWVHRLIVVTRSLSAFLTWSPAQAVWAFFIPFISLVRPYGILSDASKVLSPEGVAPPEPRIDPSSLNDYRSATFTNSSAAPKLPTPWIGPWWVTFILMTIGSRVAKVFSKAESVESVLNSYGVFMAVSVIGIVCALLGITVVRGLTARVKERFRRVHGSTPESLAAQGIQLPLP